MASRRMCTINTTQWTRNSSVPSDSMDPVNKYNTILIKTYIKKRGAEKIS